MTQTTLKVKNGTITLPKELQKVWEDADFVVRASYDSVILKKMTKDSFWQTWEKMKSVSKGIAKRDIADAIAFARQK